MMVLTPVPMKQRGFTLLELLVVLVIIGLGTAFIVPRLNSDVKFFDAQLRQLVAILKYSRRMAVVDNQVRRVYLHPSATASAADIRDEQDYQRAEKGHWYSQGIELVWQGKKQTQQQGAIMIDFFPQGGASGGVVNLQYNGLKQAIKIDSFTGKISLLERDENE